jgi:hypothetical protein
MRASHPIASRRESPHWPGSKLYIFSRTPVISFLQRKTRVYCGYGQWKSQQPDPALNKFIILLTTAAGGSVAVAVVFRGDADGRRVVEPRFLFWSSPETPRRASRQVQECFFWPAITGSYRIILFPDDKL